MKTSVILPMTLSDVIDTKNSWNYGTAMTRMTYTALLLLVVAAGVSECVDNASAERRGAVDLVECSCSSHNAPADSWRHNRHLRVYGVVFRCNIASAFTHRFTHEETSVHL